MHQNHTSYKIFFTIETKEQFFTIGFFFSKLENTKNKRLPFFDKNFSGSINLISATPINSKYLSQRGGGSLENKPVLLIGCGSVGGYVADGLIKMGIQNLLLVDNDYFEENNAFRHFLGMGAIYKNKSKALKEYFEHTNPFVNIKADDRNILDIINETNKIFEEVELAISCTGNLTLDNYLNRFFYEKEIPFIIGFNEVFDVGGHAFIINPSERGCFSCYNNYDKLGFLFVKPEKDKKFSKNITGCGGAFNQYGNLSSLKTSNLVLQMVSDYFNGKRVNIKSSWKGSTAELEKNGYKVSESYNTCNSSNQVKFYMATCKVCGIK